MYDIISDIHLGPAERRPMYPAINSFLDYSLSQEDDTLILNGDICDLAICSYEQVMDECGPIIVKIVKKRNKIWIPGNHDLDQNTMRLILKIPYTVPIALFVMIGDRTIYHGYEDDPYLDSIYEDAAINFGDRLLYQIGTDISWFNTIRKSISYAHRGNADLIVRSRPREKVVTGHTHVAAVADDGRFVNDGCCNGDEAMHFVTLDEAGNAVLKVWTGK